MSGGTWTSFAVFSAAAIATAIGIVAGRWIEARSRSRARERDARALERRWRQ